MVFKLADALSRPFHRHFSPPRNAKPSHSTRQPKTLELPQLNHDHLNPFLLPRPQRKYLETNLLDNVKISTPEYPVPDLFATSQGTRHQRCKPNLVRVSPAKILQSTELFHHPRAPFRYVNRRSEAPPFFAMFSKQHWIIPQLRARRNS